MTAALISLLVVIAFLITLTVFVSVQSFRALQKVLDNADRAHERVLKSLSELQDRFMAVDYGAFKAYQMAENADEGYIEEGGAIRADR